MNKQPQWRKSLLGMAIGLYACAPVIAAPGEPDQTPLNVAQIANPNIMLLLDSSGSMRAFVPESPYVSEDDEGATPEAYGSCPDSLQLPNNQAIWLAVKSDGRVFIDQFSGDTGTYEQYDWGTSSGTGHTSNDVRCFDPDVNYTAYLFANNEIDAGDGTANVNAYGTGSWVAWYTDRGTGTYSGRYLNWYFSNDGAAGENFGSGAQQKLNVATRTEVVARAASTLVDSLDNVNIGLTRFNESDPGGTLVKHIQDIDAFDGTTYYRDELKAEISAITPDGWTPLAEALEGIGRYFIEGWHTNNLTLHPGEANEETQTGETIFANELEYGSLSKPTSANPVMDNDKFCEKNFVIGLTDGVPQFRNNAGDDITDDEVSSYLVDYADDDDGFALSDVAKALYEMDLRPNRPDPSDASHINNILTYMIGFADETLADDPLLDNTAANGGTGSAYNADDTASLLTAFNSIKSDIAQRTASLASVAFNSTSLKESGTAVFQARFDSSTWSGSLLTYPLDSRGNLPDDTDGDGKPDHSWDAAEKLDALDASGIVDRVILTYDGSDGVPFGYTSATAAPTSEHAADFNTGLSDSTAWAAGDDASLSTAERAAAIQARLNYIRGDRSNEGTSALRVRSSRLGDIVNSTPVFVGESEIRWPDSFGVTGNRHSAHFVNALTTNATQDGAKGRTPVIYVGSNDGMLHGFNATYGEADSGKEVFAYIPRKILSTDSDEGLHYFTDSDYAHRYYVDLTPTVSDAYIKTSASGTKDWRTVLIGGLRAGGKGYFALDVTDPADFDDTATAAANTVLWEFTDDDDSDLGYTFSRPVIAKMNNGKWAAIFGNGYESANGIAKLFILFIEEGVDGWSAGEYIELNTESGDAANKNGLSTPAVADLNADGIADRIYAGDVLGNMWAFDVSAGNASRWDVAYKDGNGGNANPEPLFTANNGAAQPITSAPMLAFNTDSTPNGAAPNLLVMFGTGQYLAAGDKASTARQSVYAIWDNSDVDSSNTALARSDLKARVLTEVTLTDADGDDIPEMRRTVTGDPIDWSNDHGWYMDLLAGSGDDAAERVIASPLIRRSVLLFNTIVPNASPCSDGGTGWLMSLDFATGLPTDEGVFDADNDGDIDSDDAQYIGQQVLDGLPAQSGIIEDIQFTPTSDGQLKSREIEVGSSVAEGRLGWQELTPQE